MQFSLQRFYTVYVVYGTTGSSITLNKTIILRERKY